ncbi:hypothetical protein D9M71_620310 [compost metagenome]
MVIDLDRKLIASSWRCREIEIDTGNLGLGCRGTGQRASGNRARVWPHGLGIDFIGGSTGELDDCATTGEGVVVGRRVADTGARDLRRRGIARATRTADFIWLGAE